MNTRERLIASGQIRPAGSREGSYRSVRAALIGKGHLVPAPKGETMPSIMRQFMAKVTGR